MKANKTRLKMLSKNKVRLNYKKCGTSNTICQLGYG